MNLAIFQGFGAAHHGQRIAADLAHFVCHLIELGLRAGGEQHLAAERAQRQRGGAPERAGRTGDDRHLALDVEQR
jgi:hypothetical protein